MADRLFHRFALAKEMVTGLSGRGSYGSSFETADNGLFLAAPRRTGKTTYLRFDLTPELEAQGVTVVYADLWTDLKISPEQRIYEALTTTIQQTSGLVAKAARQSGLDKATVGAGGSSLSFDTSKIGLPDGPSLTDACRQLAAQTGGRVALILDEAQRILEADRGDDVMRELKAARDSLNTPGDPTLMLVFTGSDRDKLSRLTNEKSAAFWGSTVRKMDVLNEEYVAWVTGEIIKSNPSIPSIDKHRLARIFEGLGSRPQSLRDAIGDALNPLKASVGTFEDRVTAYAEEQLARERDEYRDSFVALTPVQRSVLTHMLDQEDVRNVFGGEALTAYSLLMGRTVKAHEVQTAMEALRGKRPSLVWKSNRSEYALEDPGMASWYRYLKDANQWPPAQSPGVIKAPRKPQKSRLSAG